MRYEEDWLMRQIHQLMNILIYLVFNKKTITPEILEEFSISEEYQQLMSLVAQGKINEAEDLLFQWKEMGKIENEIAILFYQKLSEMDERDLVACHYSQAEIRQGLLDYFALPVENIQ